MPFLKMHLRPATRPNREQLDRLLRELDHDDFAVAVRNAGVTLGWGCACNVELIGDCAYPRGPATTATAAAIIR